jgi:hypothetical protein
MVRSGAVKFEFYALDSIPCLRQETYGRLSQARLGLVRLGLKKVPSKVNLELHPCFELLIAS